MTRWYGTALACGLFPILSGTAIFAAWLVTDSDTLELAGLVVIYGGVVLVVAGLVLLRLSLSRARRDGVAYRRSGGWVLAVLLANFPLCAAYISIAYAMESAHFVTIVNRADKPVEELVLTDPTGRQFRLGGVGPGQSRHACPDLAGEGAVQFDLTIGGERRDGLLIGYLADPLGSQATLLLSEDGRVEASEAFGRISLAGYLRTCVLGLEG